MVLVSKFFAFKFKKSSIDLKDEIPALYSDRIPSKEKLELKNKNKDAFYFIDAPFPDSPKYLVTVQETKYREKDKQKRAVVVGITGEKSEDEIIGTLDILCDNLYVKIKRKNEKDKSIIILPNNTPYTRLYEKIIKEK